MSAPGGGSEERYHFVAANPREQAELDFLGGLLLRPEDAAEAIGICQPDQFSNARLRQLYEATLEMAASGAIPHVDSVAEILVSRGVANAAEICADAMLAGTNEAHTKHWAGQIARFATLAFLKTRCEEVAKAAATAPTGALESVVAGLEAAIAEARKAPLNGVHLPFISRTLSDVQPEAVEWLWKPYVPLCEATTLAGDPGVGKSTLSRAVAAALSRGWPMPDQENGMSHPLPVGDTLFITSENNAAKVIRPSLDAMGADSARIHILDGAPIQGQVTPASLSMDGVIAAACEHHKPTLLVIDPIQAHLGDEVNMNAANEVRPLLAAFARICERFRCAGMLVAHMAKGSAQKSLYRVLGSVDFVGASRSVLLLGRDPDDAGLRILTQPKCSYAQEGVSVSYRISQQGAVEWCGTSSVTAADLNEAGDPASKQAKEAAKEWLREVLADGPVACSEVKSMAKDDNIADRTLRRAREDLRVVLDKKVKPRTWRLPG